MGQRIVFARENKEFYETLKVRVNEYFTENNISKHANGKMIFKIIFLYTGLCLSYGALMFLPQTFLSSMVLWAILGSFAAFIGMAVCHDAIHGSLFASKRWNNVFSKTFNILGANDYMWSIMHNVVHHTYTNIEGHDEDIDLIGALRLSPHQDFRPIHRFQHIYAFFLYSLASLSWVFLKDFRKFRQAEIGSYKVKKHPKKEVFNLFFYKAVYYTLFIVVPFTVLQLPIWQIFIGFVTMHLFEGFLLGVTFVLAHEVEGTDFPVPDDNGSMENNWAIHQMYTTANFAPESKIVSFFVGELNHQIEHHLFPRVCHIHYADIAPIVRKTAEEFNVPYICQPTTRSAIASHYRILKEFGRGATEIQVADPREMWGRA